MAIPTIAVCTPTGSNTGAASTCAEIASTADTSKPTYIRDTMAFMFETRLPIRPTRHALDAQHRQRGYVDCWSDLKKHFTGKP